MTCFTMLTLQLTCRMQFENLFIIYIFFFYCFTVLGFKGGFRMRSSGNVIYLFIFLLFIRVVFGDKVQHGILNI